MHLTHPMEGSPPSCSLSTLLRDRMTCILETCYFVQTHVQHQSILHAKEEIHTTMKRIFPCEGRISRHTKHAVEACPWKRRSRFTMLCHDHAEWKVIPCVGFKSIMCFKDCLKLESSQPLGSTCSSLKWNYIYQSLIEDKVSQLVGQD